MMKTLLLLVSLLASLPVAAHYVSSGGETVFSDAVGELTISRGGDTVTYSTQGITSLFSQSFSSGVIVAGEIRVDSAKVRAIHIPAGGLIVGEDKADSAPGEIRSNRVKTSTLTLKGSAIFFEDPDTGVIQSTWSRINGIDMGSAPITTTGAMGGRLKNKRFVSTTPDTGDCDEAAEEGDMLIGNSPKRLYLCVDDGGGGYEWRFTNLNTLP